MEIKFELDTTSIEKALLKLKGAALLEISEKALIAGGEVVVAEAKINLENHGLHDTGDLINSIQVYNPKPESCEVGSKGVIYAAAHEFGVTIRPKRAKVLHWVTKAGDDVFAMKAVLPERAYLRPAIDENKDKILKAMAVTIARLTGAE